MSKCSKEYLEKLRKEIELNKKNAIEQVTKENMVPAMWSISRLIDLKAQEKVLSEVIDE